MNCPFYVNATKTVDVPMMFKQLDYPYGFSEELQAQVIIIRDILSNIKTFRFCQISNLEVSTSTKYYNGNFFCKSVLTDYT